MEVEGKDGKYRAEEENDTVYSFSGKVNPPPAMSRSLATMKKMGIDPSKVEVGEELRNFVPALSIEDYLKRFKTASSYSEQRELRSLAMAEENRYRQLYAKKMALQDHPLVKKKDLFLLSAYDNYDAFSVRPLSKEEKDTPRVFVNEKRREAGSMSIVDKQTFDLHWRIFSERILDIVSWDNIFIAGGSVLACLLPPPPKAVKNNKTLRHYFHEDQYAGSDIDLFIYGLNEEEGKKKLAEIYEAVCNEIPYTALAFRSAYAVTIVSQFPYRHIQIILRL